MEGPGDGLEKQTRLFWDANPCGSLTSRHARGSREFFEEVTAYRYQEETHIPQFAQFETFAGQRVLEIGVGLGSDSSHFAKAQARFWGLDLSLESLKLTQQRFGLYGLNGSFVSASATAMPLASRAFDAVYCHGVLHHIPDAQAVVKEIARILKPGGVFLAAVYHKHSIAYYWNILFINGLLKGKLLRQTVPQLIAEFTDGTGNPYALLYTRESLKRLLREGGFTIRNLQTYYVNHGLLFAPFGKYFKRQDLPRPITALLEALGRKFGWMLTAKAVKTETA
ncbi:MAG: methyltransferase domain-containing protein [Elusimicrobia bacterium]|nr:methyltransferase domain-containing protein [Elusimicrobiota bacterium]